MSRVQRNTVAMAPEDIGEVRDRVREKRRGMEMERAMGIGA